MRRFISRWAALAAGVLTLALLTAPVQAAAASVTTITGSLSDGSTYKIEVPSNWNGTLVLYSHGYSFGPSPATDVGDPATGAWLLDHRYALAGSSYATTGWSLASAFPDQIGVLDAFASKVGKPTRTIAWGHSLGGMITAGLVQLHPERFQGALPMCGVVAGGVGVWNQGLDSGFALNNLLPGGSALELVNITNPGLDFATAQGILKAAQATPAGRARIALSAALADIPGWFDPALAEPAATDFASQEVNQLQWISQVDLPFSYFGRQDLEAKAGGNPSWNTGVDYRRQLARSTDRAEVEALYAQAGLSLDADLAQLNSTPRISADPAAVSYLEKFIIYNGQLEMPVLTMHTTGDGLVEVTDENAYRSVVDAAGNQSRLRQVFVHRAGHCTFTPAETVAAFKTLVQRMDTGRWDGSTDPTDLNEQATSLGPTFNVLGSPPTATPSAFIRFQPARFLRPFDARSAEDQQN